MEGGHAGATLGVDERGERTGDGAWGRAVAAYGKVSDQTHLVIRLPLQNSSGTAVFVRNSYRSVNLQPKIRA